MIKINNKVTKVLFFIFSLILLFAFQRTNFDTVKSTINMFLSSIMPSLFPFILFTNVIINSDLIFSLTSCFKEYKYIVSCIIVGFLCGYPMGAKITYKYFMENKLSINQVKFLMSFCNNCNPIFILSTIGICVFNNMYIGIILCISHYVSALIIGFYHFAHNNIIHENKEKSNNIKQNNIKTLHKSFFEIIDTSIKSSFVVIGNIFAFILIFNLVFTIIENILLHLNVNSSIVYTLSSLFEVTNGAKMLYLNSNLDFKLLTCIISFLLGFSGMSILFQIYSCIYKSKISLLYIIKYKVIQGFLSFVITYILLHLENNCNISIEFIKNLTSSSYFVIFSCLLFIVTYTIKKVTQK